MLHGDRNGGVACSLHLLFVGRLDHVGGGAGVKTVVLGGGVGSGEAEGRTNLAEFKIIRLGPNNGVGWRIGGYITVNENLLVLSELAHAWDRNLRSKEYIQLQLLLSDLK